MKIRPTLREDLPGLQEILHSIDLFPASMLEEMSSAYFDDVGTTDLWFTAIVEDKPVALGYCVQEQLTDKTYNLLALGVLNTQKSRGCGKELNGYIDNAV